MTIPTSIDHVEAGQSRLLSQWQDKPNMSGLVQSIMESIQEIEDTLNQIKDGMGIFEAAGEQLDVIGKLVGLERAGKDDESYRQELLKQIAVNRSDGTPEVIIGLMEAATQTTDTNFWEHYPASVFYFIRGGYFDKLKELLEVISQAGVRSLLMFDEGDCFIPSERLYKLELLIDEFLDAFEITPDGVTPDLLAINFLATQFLPTNMSYLPEIQEVVNGANLWTDPATLGTGWVNNGGGKYTHTGNFDSTHFLESGIGTLEPETLYSVDVEFTRNSSLGQICFVAGGENTMSSFPPLTQRKNVISFFNSLNVPPGIKNRYLFNVRTEASYERNSFRFFGLRGGTIENIKIKKAQTINPLCDIVEFTG